MGAYLRLGDFIGSHMAIISPLCVVLGVVFPDEFSWMRAFSMGLFAFVTFQGSLTNTLDNLRRTLLHPLPMLVTLGIEAILMPTMGFMVGTLLFGANPDLVSGIVVEYSIPVAVASTMWLSLHEGDISLGLATLLVSTVLAPFTIPLTLQVLVGQTVALDVTQMMVEMVFSVALPALAGMCLNDLSHGWAKTRLAPVLAPISRVLIVVVILANSTSVAPYVRELTPMRLAVTLFIAVFAATGFAIGLVAGWLLRRSRGEVVTMTFQSGLRNITLGVVIANEYLPGECVFPVVMGTLFQHVLASLFGLIFNRKSARD